MHVPVLLAESIDFLKIKTNGVYIDATLGGGGFAGKILSSVKQGFFIGIDRDVSACERAAALLKPAGDVTVHIINDNFCNIKEILNNLGIDGACGVIFDFGLSSFQLDEAAEGFSYKTNAPLDMRMDKRQTLTARDIVNTYTKDALNRIIKDYGEERWAARIAEFIVTEREKAPINTSYELVSIIKKAMPQAVRKDGPHPAKRTFQAIRIAVNDELCAIEKAVSDAIDILLPGGRVVCISYHSLEDRIVKNIFHRAAAGCTCPRDFPVCVCDKHAQINILTRKAVIPRESETEQNPRARSAKLRAAEKI